MAGDTVVTVQGEHAELHEIVERAAREPGRLGRTAREVLALIEPHFHKEEQYVLPVLALLPKIAWGGVSETMRPVAPIARRLKAELPLMLMEHKEIVAALERLRFQASEAGYAEYERGAAALIRHAREEEEVHYPAAVLVGELLALKLEPAPA